MKTLTLLLACFAPSLSALAGNETSLEFSPLFNGEDLTGWVGQGYEVHEGAIVCTPEGKNLHTEKTFTNYVFDFEFKLPPAGNNGIGLHYPGQGNPADTGIEVQILDNTAEKYKKLKPWQFHGSLYYFKAAERGFLKPLGEWNAQRIIVDGPRVEIILNGHSILKANLDELAPKKPEHEGIKRRSGHLAFCGHGDRVAYRKVRLAELPAD
ncbi:MAG: DUF1080 domain-containing protein [Opitutales bacterium]